MKVKAVFISHLHGDHLLGLPGLLQTMGMSGRKERILVAGPKGLEEAMTCLMKACGGETGYDIDVVEAADGDRFFFKGYTVRTFGVDHNVPALGFALEEDERPGRFDRSKAMSMGLEPGPDFSRLQRGETVRNVRPSDVIGPVRKGRKVVYSGDTIRCASISEAAKDADVLIHEATYSSADTGLAREHMHSTAADAALTAKEADVSLLVITHVSNRYEDPSVLEQECREIFPDTILAKDMMTLTVK